MKQIIIGSLVGAIVLFIWSFAAWSVVPVHAPSMKLVQHEEALMAVMKGCLSEPGVYFFPAMPTAEQQRTNPELVKNYEARYQAGPIGMIIYNEGKPTMHWTRISFGLILAFFSAAIPAWLLKRSTAYHAGYMGRVMFFAVFGLFLAVFSHLQNWNWMEYPWSYTTGWIIDSIVAWMLMGLAMALIVKPEKKEAAPVPAE